MYLMLPARSARQQPAGSRNSAHQAVTVANVPGVWDLWTGTVPVTNLESVDFYVDVKSVDARSRQSSLVHRTNPKSDAHW
jgi:hypothetical protein